MKPRILSAMLVLTMLAGLGCSCNADDATNRDEGDAEAKISQMGSYTIGRNVALALIEEGIEIELDMFGKGVRDVMENNPSRFPEDQLGEALLAFQQQAQSQLMQQEAEWNLEHSQAFLKANAKRENVQTTESGLQYEIINPGQDAVPADADTVIVHYRGVTADGAEFDSSYRHGAPSIFAIDDVIDGWAEALAMMNVGARWQLYIPPHLAYGEEGLGFIGPNQVVIYGIELLDIE